MESTSIKKLLFIPFLLSSLFTFGQANSYFHQKIDTTTFGVMDTVGHGSNTYFITNKTTMFDISQLQNGTTIQAFVVHGNSGASTLTLITLTDTLGSTPIKGSNGAALSGGTISDSSFVTLVYYGIFWRVEASLGGGWLTSGNSGLSASNYLGTNTDIPLNFKVNGSKSGTISTTAENTGFGYLSLLSLNVAATGNTAIGSSAMTNSGIVYDNVAVGRGSLTTNTLGSSNTAVGTLSLSATTIGGYNVSIGHSAGLINTTGTYNTYIGTNAYPLSNGLSNATIIGSNAKAVNSNSVVIGDTINNVKVAIGTNAPQANLHVNGDFRLSDGTQNTNAILVSDADGDASWSNVISIDTIYIGGATILEGHTKIGASELIGMSTTPYELMSSGGAGTIIDITSVEYHYEAGDTAYDVFNTLFIYSQTADKSTEYIWKLRSPMDLTDWDFGPEPNIRDLSGGAAKLGISEKILVSTDMDATEGNGTLDIFWTAKIVEY